MDVAAARGAVGRPLRFAELTLDRRTRVVIRGVRRIELTPIEFALLELLLENAETVLTRSLIFERVWEVRPARGSRSGASTASPSGTRCRS